MVKPAFQLHQKEVSSTVIRGIPVSRSGAAPGYLVQINLIPVLGAAKNGFDDNLTA
jgi:hypothetical protein